jgi:acetyl-CoA synthetase
MSDNSVFEVPAEFAKNTNCDAQKYADMYAKSIDDPETFWAEQGKRLDWIKPYSKIKDVSFAKDDLHVRWFEDGILNVSANCIDRHLKTRGDQTAIIFEGDEPTDSQYITYRDLHAHVCRFANILKKHGVSKGERVTIYMPMIPEAAYAFLADFHRKLWPVVLPGANRLILLPRTRVYAAAKKSRLKPMLMRLWSSHRP